MFPNNNPGSVGSAITDRKTTQLIYVQALRFFAATAVVIFHAIGTGQNYLIGQEPVIFSAFVYGDHGVDLFFVISGFIIYYSTHRSTLSPMTFLLRRVERIVPLYWCVTLGLIALGIFLPNAFKNADWVNGRNIVESMFLVSFLDGKMPIVYVGWSLEYEIFFYLSVSLLLLRSEKAWDNLIVIFSILFSLHYLPRTIPLFTFRDFLTDPLILEFLYGIVVAKLFLGKPLARISIISITLSTLLLLATDPINRVILFGCPAAILVWLAATASSRRNAPSAFEKLCARLGSSSYSTYLIQIFVISGACKVIARFLPFSLDMLVAATTPIAVLAGYLVYVAVERPLLTACRRFRSVPRKLAPSVADV